MTLLFEMVRGGFYSTGKKGDFFLDLSLFSAYEEK